MQIQLDRDDTEVCEMLRMIDLRKDDFGVSEVSEKI